jgi:CRISPR-associated protein Csb3
MTDQFVLSGASPFSLLTHMSFYGVTAIVEGQDLSPRLGWASGMAPAPYFTGVDKTALAKAIRDSASRHTTGDTWLTERIGIPDQKNKDRQCGLFSPRLGKIPDWERYATSRHKILDQLTSGQDWVTLRFIWSLGEACYWRAEKGRQRQDDAASRLEMQPRNQGSELIANRLSPLANLVAQRSEQEILDALEGKTVNDRLGKNKPDSLSAVGFRGPGPVDDTVAWCALWGISQFALTQSAHGVASTAGYFGLPGGGVFYVPVWDGLWAPARLRSILSSRQLRAFVAAVNGAPGQTPEVARKWLASRGVQAVLTFQRKTFGGDSAPQRRAQRGVLHHVC